MANLSALIADSDSDDGSDNSGDESDISFEVVSRQGDSPVSVCAASSGGGRTGPQVGCPAGLSGGGSIGPQV